MPTIADNIDAMAKLVADTKKKHHLTENTVLRLVDMNFALAQAAQAGSFSGSEQMPFPILDPDGMPIDLDAEHDPEGMPIAFPHTPSEIDEVEEPDEPEPTKPLEN